MELLRRKNPLFYKVVRVKNLRELNKLLNLNKENEVLNANKFVATAHQNFVVEFKRKCLTESGFTTQTVNKVRYC